jgi:hypothetical protein
MDLTMKFDKTDQDALKGVLDCALKSGGLSMLPAVVHLLAKTEDAFKEAREKDVKTNNDD